MTTTLTSDGKRERKGHVILPERDTRVRLSTKDVVAYLESRWDIHITERTWYTYCARKPRQGVKGPEKDGVFGRATPFWYIATIDEWVKNRPGAGAGGGRPRKHPLPEQADSGE